MECPTLRQAVMVDRFQILQGETLAVGRWRSGTEPQIRSLVFCPLRRRAAPRAPQSAAAPMASKATAAGRLAYASPYSFAAGPPVSVVLLDGPRETLVADVADKVGDRGVGAVERGQAGGRGRLDLAAARGWARGGRRARRRVRMDGAPVDAVRRLAPSSDGNAAEPGPDRQDQRTSHLGQDAP